MKKQYKKMQKSPKISDRKLQAVYKPEDALPQFGLGSTIGGIAGALGAGLLSIPTGGMSLAALPTVLGAAAGGAGTASAIGGMFDKNTAGQAPQMIQQPIIRPEDTQQFYNPVKAYGGNLYPFGGQMPQNIPPEVLQQMMQQQQQSGQNQQQMQGQPNAEVEGQEVIQHDPNAVPQANGQGNMQQIASDMSVAQGPTHQDGGVPVNAAPGSMVVSNRMQAPNTKEYKSIANKVEMLGRKKGQLEKKLVQVPNDAPIKNALEMTQKQIDTLIAQQEQMKQDNTQKIMQRAQQRAYGGPISHQLDSKQESGPINYDTGIGYGYAQGGEIKTTQLNPQETIAYNKWRATVPKNLQYEGDYDLKGFYKENPTWTADNPKVHMVDKYKLPNHSTFSNESMYYNYATSPQGGSWNGDNFIPNDPLQPKFLDSNKPEVSTRIHKAYGGTIPQVQDPNALDPMFLRLWNTGSYAQGGNIYDGNDGDKLAVPIPTFNANVPESTNTRQVLPRSIKQQDVSPFVRQQNYSNDTGYVKPIQGYSTAPAPTQKQPAREQSFASSEYAKNYVKEYGSLPPQSGAIAASPVSVEDLLLIPALGKIAITGLARMGLPLVESGLSSAVPELGFTAMEKAMHAANSNRAYGGTVHINPENVGKFNATKERTGKTTEELTHSDNPLTRKRAIFAQNAAKWKHGEGGLIEYAYGDPVKTQQYTEGDKYGWEPYKNPMVPYADWGTSGGWDEDYKSKLYKFFKFDLNQQNIYRNPKALMPNETPLNFNEEKGLRMDTNPIISAYDIRDVSERPIDTNTRSLNYEQPQSLPIDYMNQENSGSNWNIDYSKYKQKDLVEPNYLPDQNNAYTKPDLTGMGYSKSGMDWSSLNKPSGIVAPQYNESQYNMTTAPVSNTTGSESDMNDSSNIERYGYKHGLSKPSGWKEGLMNAAQYVPDIVGMFTQKDKPLNPTNYMNTSRVNAARYDTTADEAAINDARVQSMNLAREASGGDAGMYTNLANSAITGGYKNLGQVYGKAQNFNAQNQMQADQANAGIEGQNRQMALGIAGQNQADAQAVQQMRMNAMQGLGSKLSQQNAQNIQFKLLESMFPHYKWNGDGSVTFNGKTYYGQQAIDIGTNLMNSSAATGVKLAGGK